MLTFIRIALFITSALFGLLTAGNTAATAWNGDFAAGAPVVAGTGFLTILFAGLAFIPNLIGSFWPDGKANNVPKEFADVIAALQSLALSPRDWSAQRNALVQLLEAAFAIAQAVVKDPALDDLLAQALAVVQKAFSPTERINLSAPAPVVAPASVDGKPTYAELLSR